MRNITQLFQSFQPGDFAVLFGSPLVQTLAMLLSIRAQLPPQGGGLGSNVLYIDGANTFSTLSNYTIS